MPGVIGGQCGYYLLRRLAEPDRCSGQAYEQRSKLETLFGPDLWRDIADKTVVDYGCAAGDDAIDLARHGARRVLGIDTRQMLIARARRKAEEAGLEDRCAFVADSNDTVDVVLSIDRFDHDENPDATLRAMHRLLRPGGKAFISFGPPWFHPLGGHVFSVFPWAHLIFTESALIRWRADFKADGATRFSEIDGGLSRMTVRRFYRALTKSDFAIDQFEAVPIRQWTWMANPLTREFVTSIVRCRLTARTDGRLGRGATVPIWLEDEAAASSW
jgi:SAM-dependent methyltransferase